MISRPYLACALTCMIAFISAPCAAINFRPLLMLASKLNNRKVIIPTLLATAAAYLITRLSWHDKTKTRISRRALDENIRSLTLNNDRGRVRLTACNDHKMPVIIVLRRGSTNYFFNKFTTLAQEPTVTNDDDGNVTVTGHSRTGLWTRFLDFALGRYPESIHYSIVVPASTRVIINNREDAPFSRFPDTITVDGFIKRDALNQTFDIRTNPGNTIRVQNSEHIPELKKMLDGTYKQGVCSYQYHEDRYDKNGEKRWKYRCLFNKTKMYDINTEDRFTQEGKLGL